MGLLPPGAEVEVRLDGKGYYGIWFKATVVGFAAAGGRHAPARYSVTFDGDGDGDIRRFAPTHVRPRPPAPESPPCFLVHEVIEVFHERGWWSSLVLSADPRSVTVAFPITREVITYVPRLVRPRRDYVDGDWVPSRAVVAVRPKREIRRYMVGELVEVVREREMWFPAKVGKVIDEFSYIVEYSDQKWEEGGRSEYLHWQFIRLAGTCHRRTSSTGELSAKRLEKQCIVKFYLQCIVKKYTSEIVPRQALASGKRPKSHVLVPFNGDEHDHDAEYSCAKRSMREPQQKLAVLTQGYENASVSKMGTPLSALENSLTSICPPNSCSPLYGHLTDPKIVASDNVVANCLHALQEIWTLEAANSEAAAREIETLYSKPVVFYLLNKSRSGVEQKRTAPESDMRGRAASRGWDGRPQQRSRVARTGRTCTAGMGGLSSGAESRGRAASRGRGGRPQQRSRVARTCGLALLGRTCAGQSPAPPPPPDLRCVAALSSLPLSFLSLFLSLRRDGDWEPLAGGVGAALLLFPREGIAPLFSSPLERAAPLFPRVFYVRGVRLRAPFLAARPRVKQE
ncbi:unnamed protein product [Miscanthus lutarioriparius]|uniref:Agenet domain-containing protein n=1 Tax=Miscanthus lutarioriparius TaxID=422564 RepID=A0A811QKL8_9POAL|nr:unnamed protein product [Miscanthus lutarioriparius]